MKKFLSILFASILLLLAGCENVSYPESSVVEETSADVYEQLESQLPEIEDATRQPFTIVTDDLTAFYQDETSPSMISRVLEERNTFLRDKYGAEISVKQVTSKELADELSAAVLSGLEYCDMISVSAKESVKLYKEGLLGDMNTLPDFDIENGLFDAELAKSLATNNSLYLLADPATLIYDEAYVLYFNRDLVYTPEGGEDIETLAANGKWTWDKFDEYSRLAASEVYNKGIADLENDVFAFSAYYGDTIYPLAMWSSCGNKLVDNTYRNPVTISMEPDAVAEIAYKLMDVYNVKGKYPLDGEDAAKAFTDGRLAFFGNKLSYLYALRDGTDKGDNYGILPMPKLNEEQANYHCLVSNDSRVITIPKTLETADEAKKKFVSTIISATCATGKQTIRDAYIKSHLALYLNRNSETVMLETICDSITFDFSTVYGSSISEIAWPTITAIANYLDYGSELYSSLRIGKRNFEKYCEENFK